MIYDSFEKIYEDYFSKIYNFIFGQMLNRESVIDESVELMSRDDKYYFDDPDSLKYVENRELFNILCRLTDMRYGLEMSNDEIAKIMNITPKAVSERYARLLNKCRRIHATERGFFLPSFV